MAWTEERGKFLRAGSTQEKYASRGGVQESPARCARHKHTRMAGVEDKMRAAVPSWYGGLEREIIYRRTNYIHEMSCGEVGSHLYSRMCCAGRSERSAPVTGGGSGWEGLMGMLLTFSMPPPTIQQAPRVKRVGVREVSHFIIIFFKSVLLTFIESSRYYNI